MYLSHLFPLDNYIVAHFLVGVNIFFMFFYVFLAYTREVKGKVFLCPRVVSVSSFPSDNYNYNDFFLNVNTFFKSYFFNNRARAIRTSVRSAASVYLYIKMRTFTERLSFSLSNLFHQVQFHSTRFCCVLHHRTEYLLQVMFLVFRSLRYKHYRTLRLEYEFQTIRV